MPSSSKPPPSNLPPTPSPPKPKNPKRKGQTRFEKETAATGGKSAADHPGDPKVIGPWRIGKTIGKGASGRVKIAKHNKNGSFAAVKIIPKTALANASKTNVKDAPVKHEKAILGIEREIVIMKLVDHPNVMSLYDVWETTKELFLILEYVEGGELFDYLVSQGRLHPDEASRYFQQIIAGVDYCHRFNICHRDLKPENLLLDTNGNIKIADFGMAALEPSGRLLETSCGSPHYASPEIVMGVSYHGAASDIWSCGVILFALLTGRLPFDDENIRVLLQKVKTGRFSIPPDVPSDARNLIERMLVVNPHQRISMAEIMAHPFFQRRTAIPAMTRYVEPPRLDQVARPVRSALEVDKDILRNLRTLWSGCSEERMIRRLLGPEKCMEKAFYVLLRQYRGKKLENFDESDSSPSIDSPIINQVELPISNAYSTTKSDESQPSSELKRLSIMGGSGSGGVPEKRKSSHLNSPPTSTHRGERKVSSRRGSVSAVVPHHSKKVYKDKDGNVIKVASRPAPPVPGKQSPTGGSGSNKDKGTIRKNPMGPRPPSSHATPVNSPKPDITPKSTIRLVDPSKFTTSAMDIDPPKTPINKNILDVAHQDTNASPGNGKLPMITVEIPTPQNDDLMIGMGGLGINMTNSSTNAKPPTQPPSTPTPSPLSNSNKASPMLGDQQDGLQLGSGPISVPHVQDAALQKFFHDIAEQLQLIGSASPRSSLVIDSPLQTPALLQEDIIMASTPNTPSQPTRKETMLPSPLPVPTASPILSAPPSPMQVSSPPPPPPAPKDRPAPVRANTDNGPARSPRPEPVKRRTHLGDASSREKTRPTEMARRASAKEPRKVSPSGMKRTTRPAPLDLTPKLIDDNLLTPMGSPYLGTPQSTSMPGSPLMIGPNHEMKHSWFSNLFHWKPAMFTLISSDDCASSRLECIRLLETFGATVVVEDADGWGVLKCRIDEIRDVSGIIIYKPVRFRVEFLPHSTWNTVQPRSTHSSHSPLSTPLHSAPPSPRLSPREPGSHSYLTTGSVLSNNDKGGKSITTSITLVQEKGALSAFKAVYGRLRADWRLGDAPLKSPALGGGMSKFGNDNGLASNPASPLMGNHEIPSPVWTP